MEHEVACPKLVRAMKGLSRPVLRIGTEIGESEGAWVRYQRLVARRTISDEAKEIGGAPHEDVA